MSFTRNITRTLLFTTVALALALPASAQVADFTVRVDGLSCPFCAYSLEKKLKSVVGVEDLTIDVKEGVAILTPKQGENIDVSSLPKAVKSAGFTPREIQVRAYGRVETNADGSVLIDSDGQTLFVLQPNDVLNTIIAEAGATYEILGSVVVGSKTAHATGVPILIVVIATPHSAKEGA